MQTLILGVLKMPRLSTLGSSWWFQDLLNSLNMFKGSFWWQKNLRRFGSLAPCVTVKSRAFCLPVHSFTQIP